MGVPLSVMLPQDLRQFTVPLGLNAFLDHVLYEDMAIRQGFLTEDAEGERDPELPVFGPQLDLYFRGRLADNLGLALPSFAGLELVLGAGRIGFDAAVDFEAERISITLSADIMRLRFARSLLQPVVQKQIADPNDPTGQRTITIFEADPDQDKKIELVFQVAVTVDETGSIQVRWPENSPQSLTLPPAMIGDTRVVVEGNLGIDFSTTEALQNVTGRALDPEWVGVVVRDFKIYLPPDIPGIVPQQITGNCLIGSRGLSAVLRGNWRDAAGTPTAVFKEVKQPDNTVKRFYEGAGSFSFFGLPGGMRSLELDFEDNLPVRSEVEAEFLLPFFEAPVAANLGVGLDGSIDLELRPAADGSEALVKVRKENLLELTIASLGVERSTDLVKFGLSGTIKPLIPGIEWPTFRVDELSIDTKGNIHLDGGWLNLREKYQVNFHGFQLEISKLGFGKTENGGKWIGFSGGVKLVSGMTAGASVEGLRITWYEDGRAPEISLNGVRVEFEVPNALRFDGEVSFDPVLKQFRGAVKLDLKALKMQIDATAVFGTIDSKPYLAIYLAAEFPAGIPLFATGLGVYGMAGLFALNMEPNRAPSQPWYQLRSETDWYHSGDDGVTSLAKWRPQNGSMAFGAGVTLGTIADNGHTFSGKMLLAIVFPGPILMLQGSASLLQERTQLDKDAQFSALAVLDGRAGTLQVGLDAKYRFDKQNGSLIDLNGAAEGFFNFNDPNAWRLNLGLKEPRDRRLSARLFKLFDSYSYVMLDPQQLAMGAWVGFKQQWQFGPLGVGLEAWIDGNARVSWKPAHFYGDLSLHGSARLSVFGFSAGLTVDAGIAADVFDPLHIRGDFRVGIDLPWPLSDIAVNVKLEWGPQPTPPSLPLPLKEVAVEHFKASTSWPLLRTPRGTTPPLLLPNYDANGDGYFESPSGSIVPANLDQAPIVPLDSRPHITFARNVNDDALVGVNAQRVVPEFERIGDPVRNQGPARVRYGLEEIVLEKLRDGEWRPVARKGRTANVPSTLPTLYGSWAPVPQMPGGGGRNAGQTKLWLWSKTPFEYTRPSTRAWDEWFSDEYSDYPCQTLPGDGWNFEEIEPDDNLPRVWQHPDEAGLMFATSASHLSLVELDRPSHGLRHAIGLVGKGHADITLPRPTNLVRIAITDSRLVRVSAFTGTDGGLGRFRAFLVGTPERPYIEIRGTNIIRVDYFPEQFAAATVAKSLGGAIGSDYNPALHRIIFVEFSGNLSSYDLITGEYKVLGTGYTRPEDVILSADGTVAYVTERSGALLRVDLTGDNADQSQAVVISKGMSEPHQIVLDEENRKAYVVEFSGAGRLLRIDLDGESMGSQTTLVSGLSQAVGLLMSDDFTTAYVSEQGGGGRLTRISLDTGARATLFTNLGAVFLLSWANDARDAILATRRDGDNSLVRMDLNKPGTPPEKIVGGFPLLPSSVVVLPNDRYVVCSDQVLTMFAATTLIPKILDVGANVLVRHFEDEFVRWTQAGEVLEPHSKYRLKIVTTIKARGDKQLAGYSRDETATEYAYFRTDGPPGVAQLSAPVTTGEAAPPRESALDDLSRYVRRTMPAVVAPTPQAPVPSRLFYRAYDVGIEFDENYVDLMYRLGRRDLSIHLHDGNGALSDHKGRRLVLSNQWGQAETVTLTDREERWLSVLGTAGCTLIPFDSIVKNSTFNAASAAHLLPPSSLCEARLVPALLHDDFGSYATNAGANGPGGKFERWQVRDDSASGPFSRWQINPPQGTQPDPELAQVVPNASSSLVYANTPELPADHAEQPSNWTAYRLTAHLQFTGGRVGLVFRYRDAGQHYRFVMEGGKCELIRVVGGATVSLASRQFTIPNRPFAIGIEALGSSLNVYQDGEFLLGAKDAAIGAGTVGFYSSGTASARFSDVYVDDFRSSAPVVYRFSFLSSRFKNFVDHLGSFDKKTWLATLDGGVNVAPLVNAAGLISAAPAEAELRAYDGLVAQLPGLTGSTPGVRVTRIEQNGNAIALLVQSPEPLDWKRIGLNLLRAPLKSTSYAEMPLRVLRKADGAGLVIVSPAASGSLLPPGEYRLAFTYRRDNRANDPKSELLSEAGVTSPEEATLDVPWQTGQEQSAASLVELLVPA